MTKDELMASILHETNVCKHLHLQLPKETEAFRLFEGGRTTLELLRYISFSTIGFARALVNDEFKTWKLKSYGIEEKEGQQMSFSEFPEAMDRQARKLKAVLAEIPDQEFANREVTPPWGENSRLGTLLVDLSLKVLVAYRMQLFLHAKAAGNSSLNTGDCWAGLHYEDD